MDTPQAQAAIDHRVQVWKAAYERGDASILCDAKVRQTNAPELLLLHLRTQRRYWKHYHV